MIADEPFLGEQLADQQPSVNQLADQQPSVKQPTDKNLTSKWLAARWFRTNQLKEYDDFLADPSKTDPAEILEK